MKLNFDAVDGVHDTEALSTSVVWARNNKSSCPV